MAATKELRRYNPAGAVSGSLAYDLDWELRERELRHAGEAPRQREVVVEQPQVRTRTRMEAVAQTRERQHLSIFAVAGFAAVAALAVLVLMSYIQLTALSSETVRLKNDLSQLQTQNVSLTTQYERMFDLATVKEAAEKVGMTKPSNSQICYVDLSGGDTAVVYRQEEPNALGKALTSVHHGFYAVMEYFD